MELAKQAYIELYGREPTRKMMIKFHGGFRGYNATIEQTAGTITFRLSRKFENCEPEIKIGVMQFLLNRLNKSKINTDNIDLYNNFLKRMSDFAPVTKIDPHLDASFQRCNEKYFHGMMSKPNLVWGNRTMSLLGTYEYGTDTITISKVLTDENLLDYVMYHEMLHKKHKFSCSGGRTHSHTKAFRKDEAKFEDEDAEERLNKFLARQRYITKNNKSTFLKKIMGWI